MKIQFLGGAQTVTGSKYLIESSGKRVLVDCGLFQGLKELRLKNWADFPIDPKTIDALILTHAHIDHTGYIPRLVKMGFNGPIYCSSATADLCKILLPDSGKLQEEEAGYANKRGYSKHHPALPLYTQEEAVAALKQLKGVEFQKDFDLPGGLKCRLRSSGHILGSSFVTLSDGKRSITFSGDLGRPGDLILKPPVFIEQSDYLVVESTYGNRVHAKEDILAQLESTINPVIRRKGVIVVPAFAVGRSQALLYCLYRLKKEGRLGDVPVYLNSPMSINASGIFCDHLGEHGLTPEECEGTCEIAHYVSRPEESKALNTRHGPMIIISASGMATGGRVLHHLKAFAPDPRNMILLTGYQGAGTRGAALLQGAKTLKIHGQQVSVGAEVAVINGLSGHADQREILDWMSHFKSPPKHTFVTHGDREPAKTLRQEIETRLGWIASVPNYLESVELA